MTARPPWQLRETTTDASAPPAGLFRPGREPVEPVPADTANPVTAAAPRGRALTGRPRTFGAWVRLHLFRLWTAAATLGGFGYLWVNRPEYLTWWKHRVDGLVDTVCGWLPYPWGDRIGSTIGNFGIWVQLTLAILALRFVVGALLMAVRHSRRR